MAAHEPLFRLSISLHHADGGAPVRYQDDGDPKPKGKYEQQNSLKLLHGVDYLLTVEIKDIGKTVEGVSKIVLDDNALEIVWRQEGRDEKHDCAVFTAKAKWVLSALHFGPTPHGMRDQIPFELTYMHAGAARELKFNLQAKFYDRKKKKRVVKATQYGGPLKFMEVRYDASRDAPLRWTFEEESEANPLVGISSWRAPSAAPAATFPEPPSPAQALPEIS